MSERVDAQAKALRTNFRRIERREWWLWASAFVITLLLTVALASFLLPGAYFHQDFTSQHMMSQALRGLVALVFLFDLYTIYQHLLIHRIRANTMNQEVLVDGVKVEQKNQGHQAAKRLRHHVLRSEVLMEISAGEQEGGQRYRQQ